MLETLVFCPLCESSDISLYLEAKDFTVSKEKFTISRCQSCGLLFTNPRPDPNVISKYYESGDYISHTNSKKGFLNGLYQIARKFSIRRKFDLVKKHGIPGNSILDVGCGTGEFLAYSKQNGLNCMGIEPNSSARHLAMTNYGLEVLDTSELFNLPASQFGAITMWHVLEHVHDLKSNISNLKRLLSGNGHCFIAVPNPDSFDAGKYGENWAALDVPRHLFHFKPATLKKGFIDHGFEFIASYPMKLDAFYVSLLSEKNKAQGLTASLMLRGAISGLSSNLRAANAEKYSSVIYVFKKPLA